MILASVPVMTLASAAAGQTAVLGGGGGPDVSLWRVVLALVLCLFLAGVAAWLLRTRMGAGPPWPLRGEPRGRLKLVERIVLGPQASAALVVVDGRELLVIWGPGGTAIQPVEPYSMMDAT